jgi:hypothetical protein
MIPVPSGVRVWLAAGVTDVRRGMNSLALQVQESLGRAPHAGDRLAPIFLHCVGPSHMGNLGLKDRVRELTDGAQTPQVWNETKLEVDAPIFVVR